MLRSSMAPLSVSRPPSAAPRRVAAFCPRPSAAAGPELPVSAARPKRVPPRPPENATALQKHVAFFDRNGDGQITLAETYAGCRDLGINVPAAAALALAINAGLASRTRGWPSLTYDVRNIHRSKHGSDTDVYDEAGHFDTAKFDAFFRRFDVDQDGALSLQEILASRRTQSDTWDVFGRVASLGEFGLLYWLIGKGGKVTREQLLKCYDGSLFYDLAAQQKS